MKVPTLVLSLFFVARAWSVIYGEDNRKDLHLIQDDSILRVAHSSVALVYKDKLVLRNDGYYHAKVKAHGDDKKLCAGEPFVEQPALGFCSGTLIGPDIVLTAGHCTPSDPKIDRKKFDFCRDTLLVFDYAIRRAGDDPGRIHSGSVYGCKQLLLSKEKPGGVDFALVRIDRRAIDRMPVAYRRDGEIEQGAGIFVIGHPSGLPQKVADGAGVRKVKAHQFDANLDTFENNSGSGVYNAESYLLEGVLIEGEDDFVFDKSRGCNVINRCKDTGCQGESVAKMSNVIGQLEAMGRTLENPFRE